ncbi:MAG: SDR family NAD(P)-dependent oxidoreductase, partial [Pseudomonadota bacterium]
MTKELQGRVAIITGSAMGIVRSCALRMAQEGARVVLGDVDAKAGAEVQQEIVSTAGTAVFVRADVTSMADMEALAAAALQHFGTIDILVNNAALGIRGVVDEIDEATWNRVMTTNLTSVWRGMKACVPVMRRHKRGAIVNMSSAQAFAGFEGWAAYAAAKGGINALTQQT